MPKKKPVKKPKEQASEPTMKGSEVLEKVVDLLGPNGERWLQGEGQSPEGAVTSKTKFCLWGACKHITEGFKHDRTCLEFLSVTTPDKTPSINKNNDSYPWPKISKWLNDAIYLGKCREVERAKKKAQSASE